MLRKNRNGKKYFFPRKRHTSRIIYRNPKVPRSLFAETILLVPQVSIQVPDEAPEELPALVRLVHQGSDQGLRGTLPNVGEHLHAALVGPDLVQSVAKVDSNEEALEQDSAVEADGDLGLLRDGACAVAGLDPGNVKEHLAAGSGNFLDVSQSFFQFIGCRTEVLK